MADLTVAVERPAVDEILDVDREYRAEAAAGRLLMIAPRRFNPERRRWLPILHTTRGPRHYTALFSNTARAHQLGRTNDWVVIFLDDGERGGQWTVVTARGAAGAMLCRDDDSRQRPGLNEADVRGIARLLRTIQHRLPAGHEIARREAAWVWHRFCSFDVRAGSRWPRRRFLVCSQSGCQYAAACWMQT